MASTFTSARAAAGVQPFKMHGEGLLHAAYGSIEILVNPVVNDVYEMCKLPAGAVVVGGFFYMDDIDTDSTETIDFDVGWPANGGSDDFDSADQDGLGNLGVMNGDASTLPNIFNQTGIQIVLPSPHFGDGDLPFFSAETMIQLKAIAVCATFTAGAVSVVVLYVVDDSLVA